MEDQFPLKVFKASCVCSLKEKTTNRYVVGGVPGKDEMSRNWFRSTFVVFQHHKHVHSLLRTHSF